MSGALRAATGCTDTKAKLCTIFVNLKISVSSENLDRVRDCNRDLGAGLGVAGISVDVDCGQLPFAGFWAWFDQFVTRTRLPYDASR